MDTLANTANLEANPDERSEAKVAMQPELQPLETLPEAESSNMNKFEAKRLQVAEIVKNAFKVKNNKAVSTEASKVHKKVSRHLLLTLRNEKATVVCDKTGVVSILNIPAIEGKALIWSSPLSSLENARGLAQEGYEYLNKLDTQILAGVFITLSTEYELIRTVPSATGAENNAILRTASKEKLIQGILLIETCIHSLNYTYHPKLSLIYDEVLRESGVEARLTEWMRLVEEALIKPDLEEYDENAPPTKLMRSVADLKREHAAKERQSGKKSNLKDVNFKARAQFRKDMKEAKGLVKSLKDAPNASFKLVSFLGSLFAEETYLTVEASLLDKVAEKLESVDTASAKRLIEILNVDREALRLEIRIDDMDDPLMATVSNLSGEASISASTASSETEDTEEYQDALDHVDGIEEQVEEMQPYEGEFSPLQSYDEQESAHQEHKKTMPEGLSFSERIKWKKENL